MPTEAQWTIDELARLVGEALGVDYAGQTNGRVREVPDRRTIRWYTTIGLLDRPAAMRGRTALYGRRHLLQLVAVKRLQADGRTIAEVQEALLGADDGMLDNLARLPELPDMPDQAASDAAVSQSATPTRAPLATPAASQSAGAGSVATQSAGARSAAARSAPSRAAEPAPAAAQRAARSAAPPVVESAEPVSSIAPAAPLVASAAQPGAPAAPLARFWAVRPAVPSPVPSAAPAPRPTVALVPSVRLANGVTLVLDGARPLDTADLTAIADAATALLDVLHDRGLAETAEAEAETEGGPA